jgi:hypothetical protein
VAKAEELIGATGGNEFQDHRVLSRSQSRSFPRYRSSRKARHQVVPGSVRVIPMIAPSIS